MADPHVLADADLVALRRAAAIAHSVGGVNLTLRSGDNVLAKVAPWVHDGASQWPVLSACAFRHAVARAWCDQQSGHRVSLLGLGAAGLEVEWSVRPPGSVLGFGGVRAECAGRLVWALASVLTPADLGGVLDEEAHGRGVRALEVNDVDAAMFRDERLAVSIVHIEATRLDPPRVAMLDEVLRRLVAATAAAELVDQL
jgi:hypothetical protein